MNKKIISIIVMLLLVSIVLAQEEIIESIVDTSGSFATQIKTSFDELKADPDLSDYITRLTKVITGEAASIITVNQAATKSIKIAKESEKLLAELGVSDGDEELIKETIKLYPSDEEMLKILEEIANG